MRSWINRRGNVSGTGSIVLYDIGDRPGEGEYRCKRCYEWNVTLNDGQRLPPCGKCGNDMRVSYAETPEATTAR